MRNILMGMSEPRTLAAILAVALLAGCADGGAKTVDTKEQLKKRLTPEQYAVTQQCGTEPAFRNAYWNNHEPGLYVDVVDGTPLFSSADKFDSGTGWPSFTHPISKDATVEKDDSSLGMERVEVRSKHADSHLGHVFDDGPPEDGGQRFCINSAALRFIPLADLEKEGYGEWKSRITGEGKPAATTEVAVLAGGCFWGMEELLREEPGVVNIEVGYTGGWVDNPKYDDTHDSKS